MTRIATAIGLLALSAMAASAANEKVQVCHVPKGNTAAFHTISVSVNALRAHLAHGDREGPCNAVCGFVCDDGNACTVDDNGNCEEVGCPAFPRDPVDCNDDNVCTDDSCDPASGCVNAANTASCADAFFCNGEEICQGGVCIDQPDPCTLDPFPEDICDEVADVCPACGNGIVEGTEECDSNPVGGVACTPCCGTTWYVASSGSNGDSGCYEAEPYADFTNLDSPTDSDDPGQTIVVLDSTISSSLTLEQDQTLEGNGGGNDVVDGTVTLPATGSGTTTIQDLRIEPSTGIALTGTGFGTWTTAGTVSIDAKAGPALSLANGVLSGVVLASVSSTASATDGIALDGVSGSLEVTGPTTITDASQNGIYIDGGDLDVDLAGVDIIRPLDDGIFINSAAGTLDVWSTTDIDTPGDSVGTPTTDHGVDIDNSSMDVRFADLDINDSTGHGVELDSNPGDFTAEDGLIDNPDDVGIHATTCTGSITLGTATTGLTIRETGDGAVDGQASHGVVFDDCTGAIRVENCTFADMNETALGAGLSLDNNGIHVESRDGGTLASLQIVDSVFRGTVVSLLGTTTDHGIKIVLDGGSDITDVDITGCLATGLGRTFTEVNADIDDDGDACDIGDLNISGNGTAASPLEAQAEVIHLRVGGTSDVTFRIDNNIMDDNTNFHSSGNGVRVNSGEFNVGTVSTATMTGTINDNDIDNLGDGGFDNGIEVQVQEDTRAVIAIDGNTIDGQSDDGIRARVFDDAEADLTISNNSIGNTTLNTNAGIEVQTRSQITSLTLCLDIFNNNAAPGDPFELNQDAGDFELLDISGVVGGGPTWTPAQVDTYLGSSGVNKNNIGTKSTQLGTYRNCTTIQTP